MPWSWTAYCCLALDPAPLRLSPNWFGPSSPKRLWRLVSKSHGYVESVRQGQERWLAFLLLAVGLLAVAALASGPVSIPPERLWSTFLGQGSSVETAVLWVIRLSRLLLGLAAGAALALSGAALQGALRNPLADLGLIGITAGASLGSVMVIVLGGTITNVLPTALRPWLLPVAAFLGAALVIALVLSLARRDGKTSVATLILAGVVINATA